jgi:hypothetical protein
MSIGTTQARPPAQHTRTGRRLTTWIAAGAVVLAAGGAGLALLLNRDAGPAAPEGAPPSASAPVQPSAPPSAGPSGPAEVPAFAFQPLWPFAGTADAAVWQRAYRTGGHQPWHLDPAATALAFARDHLGYTELDRTTSRTVAGSQAWIGVGAERPDGSTSTAAVVHLARIGAGADAPWEVVGTRDTTLSLTTPAYGSTVSSPVVVGGRITGVDESLAVQVRSRQGKLLGRSAGLPAGGDRTPWSTQLAFSAPAGTVLTIAVSTGGHVAAVERFAVTAARATAPAGLADGRHAARITGVEPAARRVTVDVVQIFFGAAAARAAEEDGAAEVPPPNDVWIRDTSRRLRTLQVAPGAPITVNVHGAAESGSSTTNVPRTLSQLAATDDLQDGVFWLTVADGRVTRIAEQYLP